MTLESTTIGIRRCLFGALTALACDPATAAFAEVHVEGNLNALRVTSSGDALSDVLSAFGPQLSVKYRTSVPLTAEINGAYAGSLSQVVSRLLDGYTYVIKKEQGLTEIIVFGRRGEAAIAPKPAAAKGMMSR
jgi:hypothetical protein